MLRWAVLVGFGLLACHAQAQDERIPNAASCIANDLDSGEPVAVRERVGQSSFAAYASYDADGWPAITYASAYFVLPPIVQRFLSMHECGHLVLHTTDEFRANCYAVEMGHWTHDQMQLIELSHLAVGTLGPQYGGSGFAFWEGTKQTCPQFFNEKWP